MQQDFFRPRHKPCKTTKEKATPADTLKPVARRRAGVPAIAPSASYADAFAPPALPRQFPRLPAVLPERSRRAA